MAQEGQNSPLACVAVWVQGLICAREKAHQSAGACLARCPNGPVARCGLEVRFGGVLRTT